MTSAANIIYNGANAITSGLDQEKALVCASLTASGSIVINGHVNSNGGYYQNNVKILDVDPNGDSSQINISLGYSNIPSAATGFSNIAIGFDAGAAITSGNSNTLVGDNAGALMTTGTNNVALGPGALDAVTAASGNVAVGLDALGANTASNNTAVGNSALALNTSAQYNTAVGATCLDANTTGQQNTGAGFNALGANTIGSANCALGADSLSSNTTGSNNTAVGYAALAANTTGSNNTSVGYGSLGLTTGSNNISIGTSNAPTVTTGNANIFIGSSVDAAAAADEKCLVIGTSVTGAGSNTTVIDPNYIAAAAAATHLIGYNNSSGQVFKSTTITPAITFSAGTIINPANATYLYSPIAAAPSGPSPLVNNAYFGYAEFAVGDIAAHTASGPLIITNNRSTATSFHALGVLSQSVDANSNFVLQSSVAVAGDITFNLFNAGSASTGAGATCLVWFELKGST